MEACPSSWKQFRNLFRQAGFYMKQVRNNSGQAGKHFRSSCSLQKLVGEFFLNFCWEILREIWREFGGIFWTTKERLEIFGKKFGAFFSEKSRASKKSFVPTSFCSHATLNLYAPWVPTLVRKQFDLWPSGRETPPSLEGPLAHQWASH